MRKREFLSLFSGGGLFTKGAEQAGVNIVGALEIDSKKADIYKLNFGDHIHVADIREFEDWEQYKGCWMMQVSPPCKNSSRMKRHKNDAEKQIAFDLDLELAYGVNRALSAIYPRYFVLENVADYVTTPSYQSIKETLNRLGYTFRQFRLNSADFGVPQSRDRLYLVASLDGDVVDRLDFSPYHRPRIGWYEGLERHLETCVEKTLAQYQVTAIERSIESGKIAPNDIAVLVGGAGSNPGKPGVTNWSSPSPTVRSCEGLRSGGWRPVVVYQRDFFKPFGEAVGYKLNGRCLLALQGVPDNYSIGNDVITCFVAGNGVSVPVARAIVSSIIRVENSYRSIAGGAML